MSRFSDRYGYTSVRDVMQVESMDDHLRNGLWSAFYTVIAQYGRSNYGQIADGSDYYHVLVALWKNFYKLPMDTLIHTSEVGSHDDTLNSIRQPFFLQNGLRFITS